MRIAQNDLFASIPPHTYDSFARVMQCSWSALGGPDQALLSLPDESDGLGAYRHLLGQAVEIFTGSGSKVWWGYISAIRERQIHFPQVIDLETMANRVSACFEELEPGTEPGQFRQTALFENLQSQAVYGVKEEVIRLGMTGLAQANQSAARYLSDHAWPVVTAIDHSLSIGLGTKHNRNEKDVPQTIELACRGWFQRLSWRTWQTKSGMLGHAPAQVGVQKISDVAVNQRLAQSFKLEMTQDVSFIKLRLRKEGNPADELSISIQSDDSGAPSGVPLANATLNSVAISSDGYAWCQVDFAVMPKLTAGTTYWLVVQRSGALNASAYYLAGIDESAGYANGVLRLFNSPTSVWSTRTPAADLLFRFGLLKASDELMRDVFDTVGQDFSGLQIEASTGLTLAPFAREPMDGLSAFKMLLNLGGSDLTPLQTAVSPTKQLRVFPQPAAAAPTFLIDQNGSLCDHFGNATDLEPLPVGEWVLIGNAQPVFIQKVTWEASKAQLILNY